MECESWGGFSAPLCPLGPTPRSSRCSGEESGHLMAQGSWRAAPTPRPGKSRPGPVHSKVHTLRMTAGTFPANRTSQHCRRRPFCIMRNVLIEEPMSLADNIFKVLYKCNGGDLFYYTPHYYPAKLVFSPLPNRLNATTGCFTSDAKSALHLQLPSLRSNAAYQKQRKLH